MPFQIPFSDCATKLTGLPNVAHSGDATVPAAVVRSAVEAALKRGETHYTDRPGIMKLREAIGSMLAARFRITANAKSDIFVSCGVVEARFVALQQLLRPADSVFAPLFADRIEGAVLLRRAKLSCLVSTTRVLYLSSSLPEADARHQLHSLPAETLVLFEVDEPVNTFHPSNLAAFASRTITIGQLGHESWQIGYLLSPASISASMRDFKQALTICSTNLSQWAMLAELETA